MNVSRSLFSFLGLLTAIAMTTVPAFAIEPIMQNEPLTGGVSFSDGLYRLGPGDVLSVHVYYQTDFDQKDILVRSDGFASFNGVGELEVGGRTVQEAKQMVAARLSELVVNPIVTINVSQTKPGTIYLAGAFMHPGMYQFSTNAQSNTKNETASSATTRVDLRVSNVIANGGGVSLNADLANVEIRRGDSVIKRVNLWNMIKDGQSVEDVMLESGDTVYVPELPEMALNDEQYKLLLSSALGPKTFPVRVIGALNEPGVVELAGNSPYLNSAIAGAGGYRVDANQKLIALRRFSGPDKFSTVFIDPNKMDVVLRPNDVLFVSESKIHKAGRFFEQANKILAPFTSTAFSAAFFAR